MEAGEQGGALRFGPNPARQIPLIEVVNILNTIAVLPNRRTRPQEGDLEGDYDEWFDGGAIRHVTGVNVYQFQNGVCVMWGVLPHLSITIELVDGPSIRVEQAESLSEPL